MVRASSYDQPSLPVLQAGKRPWPGRQLPVVRRAGRRQAQGERIGLDGTAGDPEHDPAELREDQLPDHVDRSEGYRVTHPTGYEGYWTRRQREIVLSPTADGYQRGQVRRRNRFRASGMGNL